MRRMTMGAAAAAAALLCAVPCRAQGAGRHPEIPDPQMDAAVARARASVGTFVQALQRPARSRSTVTAQVRFANDSVAEHIWLENVRFDGQYVTGRITEDAVAVAGVYRGQAVRVLPGELTDWMIVEDGWLCGGFSERVNAARRPADEQQQWMHAFRLRGMPGEDEVCDARRTEQRRR